VDISGIKGIIKSHLPSHDKFVKNAMIAERYYRNENDILNIKKDADKNTLRNADNKIPSNFHGLLVNQKASYMFTAPPLFDMGDAKSNKKIAKILGDAYAKRCKDLCINASNCGIAWVHYWINQSGDFKYTVMDSKQIIPVWSQNLDKELIAVIRTYRVEDKEKTYIVYEYWDENSCFAFRHESDENLEDGLSEYTMFGEADHGSVEYPHNLGHVPFIPFFNNNIIASDLDNIKLHIDAYDKVYSGFVDDLEDIQEVIFVLAGYGGSDLDTFVRELKEYKAIKIDTDDSTGNGVSTLTINIPVEAREKLLTMTRKEIFEKGQGVDPQPKDFGNASGVALKYLYSLLELKAGLAETEFKLGFGELVRAICRYLNAECGAIIQTWTRTAITNDAELAEICKDSMYIISNKSILKNHPFVEDADKEEEQIIEEQTVAQSQAQDYNNAFNYDSGGGNG